MAWRDGPWNQAAQEDGLLGCCSTVQGYQASCASCHLHGHVGARDLLRRDDLRTFEAFLMYMDILRMRWMRGRLTPQLLLEVHCNSSWSWVIWCLGWRHDTSISQMLSFMPSFQKENGTTSSSFQKSTPQRTEVVVYFASSMHSMEVMKAERVSFWPSNTLAASDIVLPKASSSTPVYSSWKTLWFCATVMIRLSVDQRKAQQLMKVQSAEFTLTNKGSQVNCYLRIHFEILLDGTFKKEHRQASLTR